MKRLLYILTAAAGFGLCGSCAQEPAEESSAPHTITFSLTGLASGRPAPASGVTDGIDLGPFTPVDFNKYAVKFYLFECPKGVNVTDIENWSLIRTDDVTSPLYRVENLQDDSHDYRYLFAAVRREYAAMLEALDFASGIGGDAATDPYPTVSENAAATPATESVPGSLLRNCYFRVADTDGIRYEGDETLAVQNDPELFAGGFFYLSPYTVHTPVGVVMHRQVGLVEFRLDLEAGTHRIACSIPTDYYRLYLSQAIRNDTDDHYTAENEAMDGMWMFTPGDYGSVSHFTFSEEAAESMIRFTKQQTVTLTEAQRFDFRVWMPYTADPAETLANDKKANYSRFQGAAATMTLTVDGKNYVYNQPFPILRNTKTFFFIKGSQLVATFGSPGGGIDLDDDDWDGLK